MENLHTDYICVMLLKIKSNTDYVEMGDCMFVLVTGSNGQLGSDVLSLLNARGIKGRGVDLPELDITDKDQVQKFILNEKPTHIIHCAAYTAVDKAETERELCRKINVCGTENIAVACKAIDAKMIYISTDYVYSGTGEKIWTEDDETSPVNWYGQTKLNGENAVLRNVDKYFIARTSWVFGKNGSNFVKTMIRLSETNTEISVVSDQIGSPTYTRDLAVVLIEMLFSENYGIYNVTNIGFCSWYEFASEIFKLLGKDIKIKPILAEEYKAAAVRPYNSRLSKEKLEENSLPVPYDWKDALNRYLVELDLIK